MRRAHIAAALLVGAACGDDGGSGGGDIAPDFDRSALLASIADRVIVPAYTDFATRADALASAAAAWSADPTDDALRASAQQAWADAADAWQIAELTQLGPAGPSGASGRVGGLGLRNEIYSWPLDNPCRVDQELVANTFDQDGYFASKLDNTYGLDALEYVLFVVGPENECPPQVDINDQGLWSDLVGPPEDEGAALRARRAAYAEVIAAKLAADADRLLGEWTGGFRDAFVNAGQGSSPYRSAQQALDEVFAAMFYLELRAVDLKLGAPAGLNARCLETICPEDVESFWADRSRTFIRQNVEAFARMYRGGPADDAAAVGFDDYLAAAGADDLVGRLGTRLDAAVAAVQDTEPPMQEALTSAKAEIDAAYDAVSELMVLVETEFVSDLALEIPREGAADND